MLDDVRVSPTFPVFLAASDLDQQPELVKFTPAQLSLDDLSKVWSVFFQTPYALSVAYEATVVLIEGDETPRAPLPVRQRNLRQMAESAADPKRAYDYMLETSMIKSQRRCGML